MTAIDLYAKDEPNIVVKNDIAGATDWYFIHTAEDQEWCNYDDMVAIATGESSRLATVDH